MTADELKLGDMLEVVGPLDKAWDLYHSELEPYVGQVGKVSYIYEDSVELGFGALRWAFLPENLRHAKADPADELNIGDMLEVVGPLDKEWDRYTSELEPYVGQVGQISCVNDAYVELDFGRFRWTFLTENLRHAKADPTADAKAVMDVLEKGVTK